MVTIINEGIFKAYDVRGVYPSEINEDAAYSIGKAFVKLLKCKKVVIGRDMRSSSPKLFKKLTKGITEMGADVHDIGMCTTPMLNFSVAHYGFDGGIMISASHNPSEYNAFKLIKPPMLQISSGFGMEELKRLVSEPIGENKVKGATKGKIIKKDSLADYLGHIGQYSKSIKGLKVVVDYGNGVGAVSAKPLLDSLDIDTVHLFEKPDGRFPNHEANPHSLSNFDSLKKEIKRQKADVGIFFDGDADRCVVVDERCDIIPPDILLGIFVRHLLKDYRKKTVYYDLRFSKAVKEEIESNGGKAVMMRVGNPFYKEKLVNEGGAFAGELSGHIMFSDNHNIDDGLFAAVRLLDIMSRTGMSASGLAKPLMRYSGSEEISKKVKDADKVMAECKAAFKGGRSIDLDGVYLEWDDWWFNLRKSNTEPLVRLRVEAKTKKLLDEKLGVLLNIIKKYE